VAALETPPATQAETDLAASAADQPDT